MAKLNINGKVRDVQVEADTPLLWVIREQVGLTGTKYGCGVAQCGACSVHINGEVLRSCSIRVSDVKATDKIVTIEGLSPQQLASRAEGLAGDRRAAMRLLPVRPDHGGGGAAQEEPEADRRGHRRGDDQHLPLRHLSAHPRGRAHGGRQRRPIRRARHRQVLREAAMTKTIRGKLQSFRAAISSSAPRPPPAAGSRSASTCRGIGTAAAQNGAAGAEVNAWVVIKPDDTCVIRIARSEMGQGTLTGLAQLVAEELECDWKKVATDPITPGQNLARKRVWGEMGTGGSRGIRTSQDYVRRGGAAARMMLLQAAADQWKVPVAELTVADGVITHAASQAHDQLRQGRGRGGQAHAARSQEHHAQGPEEPGRSPASR